MQREAFKKSVRQCPRFREQQRVRIQHFDERCPEVSAGEHFDPFFRAGRGKGVAISEGSSCVRSEMPAMGFTHVHAWENRS